jgi:hypothetical protein
VGCVLSWKKVNLRTKQEFYVGVLKLDQF